jgi:hypothetical protein
MQSKTLKINTWLSFIILLVMAAGLYILADRYLAISVLLMPALAYCGFWAVLGFVLFHTRSMRQRFLLALLIFSLILPVRFIDWDSRKPFLKDLYQVHVGMTEAQVDQIMGNYIRGSGWPTNPNPDVAGVAELAIANSVIYRHTDAGWGDSDWGIVTYRNGRVVDVRYSPD